MVAAWSGALKDVIEQHTMDSLSSTEATDICLQTTTYITLEVAMCVAA